eukprot:g3529.t1
MSQSKRGPKQSILNLGKHIDKAVRVKFQGGREVSGLLKGFDQLVNLVLDDCVEYLRDPEDSDRVTDKTRKIGLCVCRGTAVMTICPVEGMEEISNPFLQEEPAVI